MLAISKIIEQNWYQDRFGIFVVYGESGIGKSVYALKSLMELGLDWKQHVFFKPEEFLNAITKAAYEQRRIKVLVVDDAGLHLYAHNWMNPWVKSFVQFLNVARTVLANLILTTPNPNMLVRKITQLDSYYIKITKHYADNEYGQYKREAKGYKNVMLPSGARRVKLKFIDYFDVRLPDDLYQDYIQYRYGYTLEAVDRLKQTLPHIQSTPE